MPVYTVGIIQFDDLIDPNTGNPFAFTTTNTTGSVVSGYEFEIRSTATPITLFIDDDDPDFDDGFIDPPNNSTGGNNQLLDTAVTVNGTVYGPSDQVELEFGFSTSDGQVFYVVRIDGVNVGLTGVVLPQPGQVIEVTSGFDGQDEPYVNVPCFTAGTLVDTPKGPRAVETLRKGDMVSTVDAGPQPLLHVTISEISLPELIIRPTLRPIEIVKNTLGNRRTLRVSPQHAVLISGAAAEIHFGMEEVLVPAKALTGGQIARVAPLAGSVLYVHLIFAEHHLVTTEGMVSESFRPGGRAAADIEFTEIFGALPEIHCASVRPVLRVREGRVLAG